MLRDSSWKISFSGARYQGPSLLCTMKFDVRASPQLNGLCAVPMGGGCGGCCQDLRGGCEGGGGGRDKEKKTKVGYFN